MSSANSWNHGQCILGISKVWPGAFGLMSKKATTASSSYTLVAGISPAAILQKIQFSIAYGAEVSEKNLGGGVPLFKERSDYKKWG